ncbi:MAG: ethanolamine ammonia-lyase subunit EutC [Hyphomicrobium sp.]
MSSEETTPNDVWQGLRRFTDARIGLGRSGTALPTREVLKFSLAHARARDAVLTPISWEPVEAGLAALGLQSVRIASAAPDRNTYLCRPDLGRSLGQPAREEIAARAKGAVDLLIVIADGLSSKAVAANAVATVTALLPHIKTNAWSLAPILLASQARVAIGDEAGELTGAKAVLMLIGERPGLSSPDSLGAYLTFAPRSGRTDAERNCISNIRKGGLSYEEAAFKMAWLLREAVRRGLTGVELKDESNFQIEAKPAPRTLT